RQGNNTRAVAAFLAGTAPSRPREWSFDTWLTIKWFIGLLLLPVCWVTIETLLVSFDTAARIGGFWRAAEFWSFGIGAAMWLVLFFGARCRPMLWVYVAGHEWTHALFVLICRGNVAKVHISSDGGHVLTNRNNFLISLSPYFFPFYTAVAILAWWLSEWLYFDFNPTHLPWLFGVIGFTWCFHFTFTIWMAARKDQPDLDHNGRLFSFSMIALVNTLIIVSLLIVASPAVAWGAFASAWAKNLATVGPRFFESVREIVGFFV
ncbi:MAG: hypothetical protein KDM64_17145, partial [Verrucomicrobiae bacterium]|nr:hypothetical protein [Verrucomicrobiae bacterium]